MTTQQPEAHIKEPYTLAEIKAKIASNDYSAEMPPVTAKGYSHAV